MNFLRFEADEISGMNQLCETVPMVPDDPTDDPLFSFGLGKAKDCNRRPVQVMEKSWVNNVITGDVVVENLHPVTGLPVVLAKGPTPIDPADRDEIEISSALQARIQAIAAKVADSLQLSLGKAVRSAPYKTSFSPGVLQKRASAFKAAPSFDECTCAAEGRKCLACREKNVLRVVESGGMRTTYWEGGESYEAI